MRLNDLFPVAVAAGMLIMAGACRSHKDAAAPGPSYDAAAPHALIAPEQAYDSLTSCYAGWADVEVPITLVVSMPRKADASALVSADPIRIGGRARMVRGRSVDISLRMFGFEVGRMLLTPDSVLVKVPPKKIYLAESLESVTTHMPLTLDNLQDLIMGRAFMLGGATLAPADIHGKVKVSSADGMITVAPTRIPYPGLDYSFAISSGAALIGMAAVCNDPQAQLTMLYLDPVMVPQAGMLSSDARLGVQWGDQTVAGEFQWRWNQARWNKGAASAWSVPGNYRRVPFRELIKGLK